MTQAVSRFLSMRVSIIAAAACIIACFNAAHALGPPPYMNIVRLDDLSQARKDLASAFVNMSGYKRGEMREDVMFAGGDYARSGCSVSEVTDLYISYGKSQPMRSVLPIPNISKARANLAGNLPPKPKPQPSALSSSSYPPDYA